MSFQPKYMKFGNTCHISESCDIVTQPNLAITPSQMAKLVDDGIPVSSSMLSGVFNDGVSNPSWDLPIDQMRGVDVAQVWNYQKDARSLITSKVSVKNVE